MHKTPSSSRTVLLRRPSVSDLELIFTTVALIYRKFPQSNSATGGAAGKLKRLHNIALNATLGRNAREASAGRNRVNYNNNVFALPRNVESCTRQTSVANGDPAAGSHDLPGLTGLAEGRWIDWLYGARLSLGIWCSGRRCESATTP